MRLFKNQAFVIDTAINVLNISNTYSIIPYLLISGHRGINTAVITIINILYIIFRFRKAIYFPKRDILFYLYLAIFSINMFFGLITKTFSLGLSVFLFANVSFYIILSNQFVLYNKSIDYNKCLKLITRSYMILCLINVISILTLFVLVTFLNFNPYINVIDGTMDLLDSDLGMDSNISYFFPHHISILYKVDDIRIPFFQQYGLICGLYHEPHIVTYLLTPSLFLSFIWIKDKLHRLLIVFAYIFIVLIAASTTNIFALVSCIIVYSFINKKSTPYIIGLFCLFLGILIYYVDASNYLFIFNKLESDSNDYSSALLKFAFTPRTWLGSNFLNLSYIESTTSQVFDVGYIVFFLNFLFISIIAFKIFHLLRMSFEHKMVGLFALYFILHSMKLAMLTYTFSYLLFVIFVIQKYIETPRIAQNEKKKSLYSY